jgi:hypothetical protein
LAELISRAGGLTTNAYLFGAEFTREEVQKSQKANLARLITRIENESQSNLTSLAQNAGGTLDAATLQARLAIAKEEQLQTIKRLKELQPSGRIALSHPATETNQLSKLPSISLQPFDRLLIAQAVSLRECGSIAEDIPIISKDTAFDSYEVKRLW